MSTWGHSVLFICPKGFEGDANATAQAVAHQPGDDKTFGNVWYAQKATPATQYVSVANTRLQDTTFAVLENPSLLPSPPPHGANVADCAKAISALKPWVQGGTFDLASDFVYAVDTDPQSVLTDLGLVPWQNPNVPTA